MSAREGSVTLKSTLSRGIKGGGMAGTARVELIMATELLLFLFGREWGRRWVCSSARSSLALLVVGGSRISLGMLLAGARGEGDSWWTGKVVVLLFRVELEDALWRFTCMCVCVCVCVCMSKCMCVCVWVSVCVSDSLYQNVYYTLYTLWQGFLLILTN